MVRLWEPCACAWYQGAASCGDHSLGVRLHEQQFSEPYCIAQLSLGKVCFLATRKSTARCIEGISVPDGLFHTYAITRDRASISRSVARPVPAKTDNKKPSPSARRPAARPSRLEATMEPKDMSNGKIFRPTETAPAQPDKEDESEWTMAKESDVDDDQHVITPA